jgi:N-formylglutamate amidohydrolase
MVDVSIANMASSSLPPWVVLHVPHDATFIPAEVRDQFVLSDEELRSEVIRMTDHLTESLFAADAGEATVVRAPVSRLVIDVERFADDALEPMASRGMGAVYRVTSALAPLRRPLADNERLALMQSWYHPHHDRLERTVAAAIGRHGRCLVLDCHSFPSVRLPYEQANASTSRPDICIGTDAFHTGEALARAFVDAFEETGWTVTVNEPFSGAMVPANRYRSDRRVSAVMVEVNRQLYLNEVDATPAPDFVEVAARIRASCIQAIAAAFS